VTSMAAGSATVADLQMQEPSALRSFWASVSAVIVKELRWRMRGRRAFVIVTIYVALLALLVFLLQRTVEDSMSFGFDGDRPPPGVVSGAASAALGQSIFGLILGLQMLLTLLLAPALTSGGISMEREKQTLELLIATPVSSLGLVVGKLIASLAYVVLLILASIPLMSIVFAFGGIAPDDVLRAYVMLFAVAFGTGAIGVFMSGLLKRTQIATALSYVIVFFLAVVTLIVHTWMLASSTRFERGELVQRRPPEAILWLNPVVAGIDLACTAIPDSYTATCAYIATIGGWQLDPANPPRDAYWPRSAAAFVALGLGLTLATTQLIAPSRRMSRQRTLEPPEVPEDVPAGDDLPLSEVVPRGQVVLRGEVGAGDRDLP